MVEAPCQTEAINSTKQHVERQTGVISYQFQDFGCQVNRSYKENQDFGCQFSRENENDSEGSCTSIVNEAFCAHTFNTQYQPIRDIDISCDNSQTSKILLHQNLASHHFPDNVSHSPLPDQPFASFDVKMLDHDINYYQRLGSRSTSYYGDFSYSYGKVKHEARTIPKSGNYLCNILRHVNTVLPSFKYNSVLVTRYSSGSDFLSYHSDDEPEIVSDSNILTISLGATRICKFRKLPISTTNPEHSQFVRHGDAIMMSRKSQDLFQHSIIPDDCQSLRISITLRLLRSSEQSHSVNPVVNEDEGSQDDAYTVYIGDSMFRNLNSKKLSSNSQKAIVLYYPGATASGILNRLQNDPVFRKIESSKVKKIILFAGSNNVDNILNVPSNLRSSLISDFNYVAENMLNEAKIEISELIGYLHSWCSSAKINIVNILPRKSLNRNTVINALNLHIKNLSIIYNNNVCMVSTELHRSLFSFNDGNRKENYFSFNGSDNVHLNNTGLVRLAKYLKYFAHHSLSS